MHRTVRTTAARAQVGMLGSAKLRDSTKLMPCDRHTRSNSVLHSSIGCIGWHQLVHELPVSRTVSMTEPTIRVSGSHTQKSTAPSHLDWRQKVVEDEILENSTAYRFAHIHGVASMHLQWSPRFSQKWNKHF